MLDYFWFYLILVTALPVVQRLWLMHQRQSRILQFEKRRGSRFITLIHRQETAALLGIPIARYIDIEDSEAILTAIRLTPGETAIDILLHTPGGLVLASEQIAEALRRHEGPVRVLVPHYALSGGTLIALAADEVIMDANAVLGPVDPQIGEYPAASILNAMRQGNANRDDRMLVLADIAEKALRQMKATVLGLLKGRMPDDRAEALAEALTQGYWTHDYPISADQGKSMGLPISTEMPEEVYELMSLYRQSSQRRPSVEYVPIPYPAEPSGRRGGSRK